MSQRIACQQGSVLRRIRLASRLLLAFLLVPLPVLAQGPPPVGLHPIKGVESLSLSRDSRVKLQRSGRGTEGFVIGFAAGFFGTILATKVDGRSGTSRCGGCRSEDNGLIGMLAIAVGVLGGFIGYLIGRAY